MVFKILILAIFYFANNNAAMQNQETVMKQSIQDENENSREKRMNRPYCTPPFIQVGASCYYRPGLSVTWTDAVAYCTTKQATLPIFYNASEYLAFANWWNTNTTNKEVWLGITYDSTTNVWTWLNNCTWKHYPSFFRSCFDKDCLIIGIYYAKYSNIPNNAATGVDPISSAFLSSVKLEVVCYKPLDETTSGCYEFAFEKKLNSLSTNFLCNLGGWWCATENSFGQHVATAVASDSCFCLYYHNETVTSAEQSCNTFNGNLSDIRSEEELYLIAALVNDLIAIDAIQDYMCPPGYSYFNHSCFATFKPNLVNPSGSPGKYVDDYCTANYQSVRGASLHSFDEQWFLFHLYYPTFGYTGGIYFYLGAYKNDTSSNFTYNWYDGSPTDFIPKWGFSGFWFPENNQYNWPDISIEMCFSGDLCDDSSFPSSYGVSCRAPIPNYPVYPILLSSVNTNSVQRHQYNLLNSGNGIIPLNASAKPKIMSKICRKDRIVWEKVDDSHYYMKSGLLKNWTESVKFCKALNSTLPIFQIDMDYSKFKHWWNGKAGSTDAWLGLTYDPSSNHWTWINNCSWKHFPAFWRSCWDKNCSLPFAEHYAKYSNQVNGQYAPNGVEPVLSTYNTSIENEVVCFKATDRSTTSCFHFPSDKDSNSNGNGFLCSQGWLCTKDHPLGQTVTTAINADSCFCLSYFNKSSSLTDQPCSTFNGSLADVRSREEATLFVNLIEDLTENYNWPPNICQTGFYFFNGSCYGIIMPTVTSATAPGQYVNDYCRITYSAQSASMHSMREQWFWHYLHITTFGYTYGEWFWLGANKTDNSSAFKYQWYDGTPMDYVPDWGLYKFTAPQNTDYSVPGVGLMIQSDDGKLGDYTAFQLHTFACKSPIEKGLIYPILVSSTYLTNNDANCYPSCSHQNLLYHNITLVSMNRVLNSQIKNKICRIDRLVTTSTASTKTTIKKITPKPTIPMTKTEETVATVLSTIGCTWIIVTTGISMLASLLFRSKNSFSFERKIRLGQEVTLCLAHILILTFSSKADQKVLCNGTALGLQFFFTSYFIFLLVESFQTYYIYTNVISSDQFASNLVTVMLVLGIPGLLVALVAIFAFDNLASTFTCFVNYDNPVCLANLLPGLIVCTITTVVTESSGIGDFKDLPLTSVFQKHSARVSKSALLFKIPLSISSWMLMTIGLHYQRFYLFTLIFGFNVVLGWSITLFHLLENEEVLKFLIIIIC